MKMIASLPNDMELPAITTTTTIFVVAMVVTTTILLETMGTIAIGALLHPRPTTTTTNIGTVIKTFHSRCQQQLNVSSSSTTTSVGTASLSALLMERNTLCEALVAAGLTLALLLSIIIVVVKIATPENRLKGDHKRPRCTNTWNVTSMAMPIRLEYFRLATIPIAPATNSAP